jgi:hypothetical protein
MPDFGSFLDTVFDQDGLRIYELPDYNVVGTS